VPARQKAHGAQGGVNVLSGAPFGYRYVRKSDTSTAYYEVVEAESKVVRMVFEIYTQQRLSINAIARLLNERQIATRTGKGRWERSTVWGMLRNPAYPGTACHGKTEQRPRQRVTFIERFTIHGLLASISRIRYRAGTSQAMMVGAWRKHCHWDPAQHHKLSSRRCAQRRTVDASGEREGSLQ
jgi:hypothetical protein